MNLFGVLSEVYPTLLTGLTMTVKITILSLIIALVIGIFVCLMNISSNIVLRGIAKFYIWLIRGTPMLWVQEMNSIKASAEETVLNDLIYT